MTLGLTNTTVALAVHVSPPSTLPSDD